MKGKFLILGAGGMLGYGVSEYFKKKSYDVIEITRNEYDVVKHDLSKLEPHIKKSDFIINCIGIIKPTVEQNTPLDVIKINGVFPRNIAKLCKALNKPLIHITTDCAFTGKKGKYNEKDIFDADDFYGSSKISGETNECLTFRTSFVGPEKNTKRSLLEWAFSQRGKTVNGFTNHVWNGLTTIYFAEVAEKIYMENLYKEGIFHLFSPDSVTKFELVSMFNDVFKLNMTINPAEAKESCDRSLTSIYDVSSKVSTKPLRQQMEELKTFFNL